MCEVAKQTKKLQDKRGSLIAINNDYETNTDTDEGNRFPILKQYKSKNK